nr:cytochrome c oxidase assembly factor 6 homolog isoform X1 [Manis javanica]
MPGFLFAESKNELSKQSSLSPLGMAAPSMKEREVCWGARDEYWKCLDENTDGASQLRMVVYEVKHCLRDVKSTVSVSNRENSGNLGLYQAYLWKMSPDALKIKYFDKRRDYLKFKEKFEAGKFQPSKTTTES